METPKRGEFLARFLARTQQLAADIEDFQSRTPQTNRRHAVRQLLQRFYNAICDLSEYKPESPVADQEIIQTDKAVLEAWYALLVPIRALSSWTTIPNGLFLAARMALFAIMAFMFQEALPFDLPLSDLSRDRVRLQMDFGLTLNETLLAVLRNIWRESGNNESFRWAMTHLNHENHCIRTDYNQAAMLALSPTELWQVPGMTGTQQWVPEPGAEPIYDGFDIATVVSFGEPDQIGGKQPVIKQTLYSEGPIRFDMTYCLFDDDSEEWHHGPKRWRALQFILDARQIMYPRLVKERERLASRAMDGRLPLELQRLVLDHLEKPIGHPYLSHLDLPSVYAPFPSLAKECGTCEPTTKEAAKSNKQGTCPHKSIYIWNLALRAFHTFHESADGNLSMCFRLDVCAGHHEDPGWDIPHEEALRAQLERIVRSRCGRAASLKSVGLGGLGSFKFMDGPRNYADLQTWLDLPACGLDEKDFETDLEMANAMGLANAMVHNFGFSPRFGNDRLYHGHSRKEPAWIWAWSTNDKDRAMEALRKTHRWCPWCDIN
ncbi:hypothetical protein BKA56DRAFT_55859 [Ilyonectria sp. MPI-CAGE-AT-0026]|nr:hypothetical protein BKA56DRAFT_55859 [Ilyonectria sp. MPI-CAGE-AT-0026]